MEDICIWCNAQTNWWGCAFVVSAGRRPLSKQGTLSIRRSFWSIRLPETAGEGLSWTVSHPLICTRPWQLCVLQALPHLFFWCSSCAHQLHVPQSSRRESHACLLAQWDISTSCIGCNWRRWLHGCILLVSGFFLWWLVLIWPDSHVHVSEAFGSSFHVLFLTRALVPLKRFRN